jgi:hypothetical protein
MSEITLKSRTIINLSNSEDACAFDQACEIIQRDAMNDFFKYVSNSQEEAINYRSYLERGRDNQRKRYHDTIMVCGSRGSGKSSFILSMFELLRNKDKRIGITAAEKINDGDIYALGILDPTLIEDKEHIFVHILSLIKEHVDSHYERRRNPQDMQYTRNSSCNYNSISEECYRDWLNQLQSLAAGLPSIDGVGEDFLKSERWHDPVYVLDTGLANTRASHNMEINFHRFINKSLRLLDKKAFIIGFDDIDTKFRTGWPLLEIMRKYLTTPQLITVLTGDPELYSILVRSEQWKNLGDDLLKNETGDSKKDNFNLMVNKLTEQYMLKLLKPMRRLELQTLQVIYENERFNPEYSSCNNLIEIMRDNNGSHTDIKAVITTLVETVFHVKGNDLLIYVEHIMRDRLRTILRLVRSYYESCERNTIDEKWLVNVFINIYQAQLQQFDINIKALRDPDIRVTFNQLVIELVHIGQMKRGYRIKADYEDSEYNRMMLVLAAVYTLLLKNNPAIFFEYLIKVGLTHEVMLLDMKEETPEHYLEWVGLRDGESSVSIGRLFNGYIRSHGGQLRKATVQGTISLLRSERSRSIYKGNIFKTIARLYDVVLIDDGSDPRNKLKQSISDSHPLFNFINLTSAIDVTTEMKNDDKAFFFNTLEELEDRISSWHWRLITLPVNRVVDNFNNATVLWSIHGLIAVIAELLMVESTDEVRNIFLRSSQIRDYPLPSTSDKVPPSTGFQASHEEISTYEDERETIPEGFVNKIVKWKNEYNSISAKLPIHIVAKMFTRFYYSLGRLDDELPKNKHSLGNIIHRYVVIFINSVLIEECLHLDIGEKIKLKNPVLKDDIFVHNMQSIEKNRLASEVGFSLWLAKCPLWGYFLDYNSKPYQQLKRFSLIDDDDTSVKYLGNNIIRLYDLLNSVVVNRPPEDSENPKKPYSTEIIYKILQNNNEIVLEKLQPFSKAPVGMTNEFIKFFLSDVEIPKKSKEPQFAQLREILVNFVKQHKNKQ